MPRGQLRAAAGLLAVSTRHSTRVPSTAISGLPTVWRGGMTEWHGGLTKPLKHEAFSGREPLNAFRSRSFRGAGAAPGAPYFFLSLTTSTLQGAWLTT